MAKQDVATLMSNFNKGKFETEVKQAVSGLPIGANISVETVTSNVL